MKKTFALYSLFRVPRTHFPQNTVIFHLDLIPIKRSGVDMMSFNSGKIGGPAGIAILYKKKIKKLSTFSLAD